MTHRPRLVSGFTLVEMIVAVAVFIVVMVSSIGALMSMIDANRKAQALRTAMDNLNFALENVTRAMRVGIDYHCGAFGDLNSPRDCPVEGDSFIAFKDSDGEPLIFRLNNKRIERSTDGGATYLGITAPEITIQELKFFVRGSTSADKIQPEVLMIVRGTAGATERVRTTFNLQTTASQRMLDVSSTLLPPPPPPASAFPVVAATNTSAQDPSNSTSHTVILPTGVTAGDLLIIFAELGNTVSAGPLGWTQLFMLVPGTVLTGYYKVAVGGDANPVITTSLETRSTHISYRITGFRGSPEVATNPASLDPPVLAPSWGSAKTLWLVVGGDNEAAASPAPINYTNLLQGGPDSFNHNFVSSARRELESPSDNPSAFGGGQEFPASATVAIRPAGN